MNNEYECRYLFEDKKPEIELSFSSWLHTLKMKQQIIDNKNIGEVIRKTINDLWNDIYGT